MLFVELGIASLLIIVAGSFLTKAGDRIAKKTGLGGAWVGLVLLAFATSLPELVTCLGAVTIPKEPDLVFGDVLGSNAFNLLIIVLLDILCGRESILVQVGKRARLSAWLGLVMMTLVLAPLALVQSKGPITSAVGGWIWLASPVLIVAYFLVMRLIFVDERKAPAALRPEAADPPPAREGVKGVKGVKRELITFAVGAAFILGAGLWLSDTADRLASYEFQIGGSPLTLGHTFIGALLLAVVTSLPELVVTIASFRLGAHAMAVGNLLGSNIFNMAIVAVSDAGNWLASGKTIFLGAAEPLHPIHVLTAVIPMLMTIVVLIGLSGRRRRRILPAGWETIVIALIYVAGMSLVFRGSASH